MPRLAGVRVGDGNWPGIFGQHLMDLQATPIARPAMVRRFRLERPGRPHPRTVDPCDEARRDAELVGTTGLAEDRAVVQAIQRRLGSGANDAFTFGHFESAIVHFHKTLAAAFPELRSGQKTG